MPYPTDRETSLEEIIADRLSNGGEFRKALEGGKELEEFLAELLYLAALAGYPKTREEAGLQLLEYVERIFLKYVDQELESQRDDDHDFAPDDTSFG